MKFIAAVLNLRGTCETSICTTLFFKSFQIMCKSYSWAATWNHPAGCKRAAVVHLCTALP